MKAEETVKKSSELCLLVCREYRDENLAHKNCEGLDCEDCQLLKQAQISFKAGIKEAGNWLQNKIAEQRAGEQFIINIDQINSLLNGNIPEE